jgi:hypothetical protein
MCALPSILSAPPAGYLPLTELARELGLSRTAIMDRLKRGGVPVAHVAVSNRHGVVSVATYAKLDDVLAAGPLPTPRTRRTTGPRVVHPKKAEA